jgi:hypothetical protein
MKVAQLVLAGALATGADGTLAACRSSSKTSPSAPGSGSSQPSSTTPNTTAPSGGGVSY